MPKLKTNKAVKKRFKITAKGKVMGVRTKRRHLLSYKNSKSKRKLRGWTMVDPTNSKQVKEALPYS